MSDQKNKIQVIAPDITCGGCASAIRKALGSVDGVNEVEVNVESKTITVDHASTVNREQIIETLERAGFPAD